MSALPFSRFFSIVASTALTMNLAFAQDPFGDAGMGQATNPFGGMGESVGDSPFGGFAQPDATGSAAAASAATPAAGSAEVAIDDEPDPVVRMLRQNPPQTPADMAQGLTWMIRFKRWDEVRRLLDSVSSKGWSLDQLSELAKSGEASLWLRLSADEAGLSDAQKQLLSDVQAAPTKLARDPAWLERWIEKLASPQPGERRLAQLRLQDGGTIAIGRLMDHLLAGDSKVDAGMLAGTIAQFGERGVEALKAACLVKDASRAARVYMGLTQVPGKEFSAELGAGVSSARLSVEARTELAELLTQKYGGLPSVDAVHDFLAKRFATSLANYQQTRVNSLESSDIVWRQTSDGKSIVAQPAQEKERWLEATAQLGAHRMNLSVATSDDLVESAAVVMQRAYKADPQMSQGELQSNLIAVFDQELAQEAGFWMQVFDRATELQMHGGAIRAMQMLIDTAPGNASVPLDFLSHLLGDSRPVVRYWALQTLAAIDPQQSYPGAEKALEVALEMSRIGSGPHALVVGLQSEMRQAAAQQLQQQIGATVTTANSARSALLALDGPSPIEMVFVVDRVADQSIYELLQRLRGSERGQALPIAVLTEELYSHERQYISQTGGIVASVLSNNAEQMQRVVGMLTDQLDTAPISVDDRISFSKIGGAFLSKVASDRDLYAFYPISDWRSELIAVGAGLDVSARLNLLAGLGSPDSQSQLASLASHTNLTDAERYAAARAFGRSVQRFGMNLSKENVQKSYDLYNALGPNNPGTAAALGLVLDSVEAQAGQRGWPEGL